MRKKLVELETRKNDLLTNYLKTRGWSHNFGQLRLLIGSGFCYSLRVSKEGTVTNYVKKEEIQKIDKIILKKIRNGSLLSESNLRKINNKLKIIEKRILEISLKKLTNLNNNNLLKLYDQYCRFFESQAAILYIPFRLDNLFFPNIKIIKDFILKKTENLNRAIDWTGILSLPLYKTYLIQEEEDFLKIVLLANRDGAQSKGIKKRVISHAEKYSWIPIQQDESPWDYNYFFKKLISELKHIKKIKLRKNELSNYITNLRKKQSFILKRIKPTKEINKIIYNFQKTGILRDRRKKIYSMLRLFSRPIIREISRRISFSPSLIGYMTPEEIKNILDGSKISKKEILRRKSYYVLELMENKVHIHTALGFHKKLVGMNNLKKNKTTARKELKGIPANVGKTKGIVKIIRNLTDPKRFKKGNILISVMTTPEVVPIMKKAAAIITDEGGLTCHAAIVSRELNIPCIVGTKIATKVLKDGDKVLVDANKGIVKKI